MPYNPTLDPFLRHTLAPPSDEGLTKKYWVTKTYFTICRHIEYEPSVHGLKGPVYVFMSNKTVGEICEACHARIYGVPKPKKVDVEADVQEAGEDVAINESEPGELSELPTIEELAERVEEYMGSEGDVSSSGVSKNGSDTLEGKRERD